MLGQCSRFTCSFSRKDDQIEDAYRNDMLYRNRCTNPNWDSSYSIWDRVCMEEIFAERQQLEELLETMPQLGQDEQKAARDKLWASINEKFLSCNEEFEEVLQESAGTGMHLTKSKLELMLEAQIFGSMVSNLPAQFDLADATPSATTEAKVNLSLSLANLTLDVNHILGALIYLAQSVQKDFNQFTYG